MQFLFRFKAGLIGLLALMAAGSVAVFAQLEGTERGVAPLASTGDFEVAGVTVNVEGDDSFQARKKGWEQAQRKAWKLLYGRTNGGKTAGLSDGALNNIVSAIVVEKEQIGPKRYIATLGVMFDRARAGQILGVKGRVLRSPPLLVLPIMWSGGSPQVFENRTEWQKAWARFRSGDSVIDYVRPHGSGSDSLLLTAGQANRRDRQWWRMIFDQFGAADVIIPMARLEREWPGGPVTGYFSARYGPDNRYIDRFKLKVKSSKDIPEMMNKAVIRLDEIYSAALSQGVLKTDKSLLIEDLNLDELELEEDSAAEVADDKIDRDSAGSGEQQGSQSGATDPVAAAVAAAISVNVQFDTPDVGAVSTGEASVRSVPGVASAATSSLALGGVSVMAVSYNGDIGALAGALRARGWQVQQGAGVLRIRRGGGQ